MSRYKFSHEMRKPYRATIIAIEQNWRRRIVASWEEPYDPKRGDIEQLYGRLKKNVAEPKLDAFRKAFEKWRLHGGLFVE